MFCMRKAPDLNEKLARNYFYGQHGNISLDEKKI